MKGNTQILKKSLMRINRQWFTTNISATTFIIVPKIAIITLYLFNTSIPLLFYLSFRVIFLFDLLAKSVFASISNIPSLLSKHLLHTKVRNAPNDLLGKEHNGKRDHITYNKQNNIDKQWVSKTVNKIVKKMIAKERVSKPHNH